MGGKFKPKPHLQKSIIAQTLEKKKTAVSLLDDECLLISFRHLDKSQGQNVHHWQETKMLAEALDVLAGACTGKATELFTGKKFTVYGGFPPKEKTSFTHPIQVPEDAQWARIHVNGAHCLIGHLVKNTFYLVFFDEDHKFWYSEKN